MSEENKNKDLDDKTNNEILFEVKQMEADYEALKLKMLNQTNLGLLSLNLDLYLALFQIPLKPDLAFLDVEK